MYSVWYLLVRTISLLVGSHPMYELSIRSTMMTIFFFLSQRHTQSLLSNTNGTHNEVNAYDDEIQMCCACLPAWCMYAWTCTQFNNSSTGRMNDSSCFTVCVYYTYTYIWICCIFSRMECAFSNCLVFDVLCFITFRSSFVFFSLSSLITEKKQCLIRWSNFVLGVNEEKKLH